MQGWPVLDQPAMPLRDWVEKALDAGYPLAPLGAEAAKAHCSRVSRGPADRFDCNCAKQPCCTRD
jgi:hypothetical protein